MLCKAQRHELQIYCWMVYLKRYLKFFKKKFLNVGCVWFMTILLVHVALSANAEAMGTSGAFPHYSFCLTAFET